MSQLFGIFFVSLMASAASTDTPRGGNHQLVASSSPSSSQQEESTMSLDAMQVSAPPPPQGTSALADDAATAPVFDKKVESIALLQEQTPTLLEAIQVATAIVAGKDTRLDKTLVPSFDGQKAESIHFLQEQATTLLEAIQIATAIVSGSSTGSSEMTSVLEPIQVVDEIGVGRWGGTMYAHAKTTKIEKSSQQFSRNGPSRGAGSQEPGAIGTHGDDGFVKLIPIGQGSAIVKQNSEAFSHPVVWRGLEGRIWEGVLQSPSQFRPNQYKVPYTEAVEEAFRGFLNKPVPTFYDAGSLQFWIARPDGPMVNTLRPWFFQKKKAKHLYRALGKWKVEESNVTTLVVDFGTLTISKDFAEDVIPIGTEVSIPVARPVA